jgi:hypothetical protein
MPPRKSSEKTRKTLPLSLFLLFLLLQEYCPEFESGISYLVQRVVDIVTGLRGERLSYRGLIPGESRIVFLV